MVWLCWHHLITWRTFCLMLFILFDEITRWRVREAPARHLHRTCTYLLQMSVSALRRPNNRVRVDQMRLRIRMTPRSMLLFLMGPLPPSEGHLLLPALSYVATSTSRVDLSKPGSPAGLSTRRRAVSCFYYRMAQDINPLGKVDVSRATFSYPLHGEEGTFHIQTPERTVILKVM